MIYLSTFSRVYNYGWGEGLREKHPKVGDNIHGNVPPTSQLENLFCVKGKSFTF